MWSWHMLELDVFEGLYHLLKDSLVGYQADFFKRDVTVDLLNNEFESPHSLSLRIPIFKAEASPVTRVDA